MERYKKAYLHWRNMPILYILQVDDDLKRISYSVQVYFNFFFLSQMAVREPRYAG